MDIDFIRDKKNHVTVSSFESGTTLNLTDVHTVKAPMTWAISNGSFAWFKLNVYEQEFVNRIYFTYSGTYTNISIETSIDNINWTTITAAFSTSNSFVDLTYLDLPFNFIRLMVTNPSTFVFTDLEIWGDATISNENFLSHFYYRMYGKKFIENNSLLPELTKEILRMLEGNNQINLKLFDETLFTTSAISLGAVGDLVTLTPDVPTITDAIYIWDFDEKLLEADVDYDILNPNIIIETTPNIQTHTYKKVGLHVPRLILRTKTYSLEFTETFTKT